MNSTQLARSGQSNNLGPKGTGCPITQIPRVAPCPTVDPRQQKAAVTRPDSSPLSEVPSAILTPIAKNVVVNSSPLSSAPQTPTPDLGNSMLSSSPMYTPHTEHIFATQRATQRRLETLQQLKKTADAEKAAAGAAEARQQEDDVKKKKAYFDKVLGGLEEQKYSLADFMEYVFNPDTQFHSGYDWQWRGFFAHKPVVKRLVRKVVAQESRRITLSGILSKTKRQLKTKSKGFLKRRDVLAGSVALALLNGRSQNNSFAQAVCGTYLMATGRTCDNTCPESTDDCPVWVLTCVKSSGVSEKLRAL
ncbi:hypothetical protein B0H13DRAFT_1850531 [Mycena leptocephala]|nr:hypothetical protein B0H13DRAFT_1850531 [Mycena leptocephala]